MESSRMTNVRPERRPCGGLPCSSFDVRVPQLAGLTWNVTDASSQTSKSCARSYSRSVGLGECELVHGWSESDTGACLRCWGEKERGHPCRRRSNRSCLSLRSNPLQLSGLPSQPSQQPSGQLSTNHGSCANDPSPSDKWPKFNLWDSVTPPAQSVLWIGVLCCRIHPAFGASTMHV